MIKSICYGIIMKKYQPGKIEQKWQEKWEEQAIYKAQNRSSKPKKYVLDMFPYPSGEGLHVGHFKGYVATDVISRFYRMKGFNVLHPMGWDSFGLPAENYAIKTGIHPKITTEKNISNIKRQMKMVGLSYDWDREFSTTDEDYYKWTQWIFLKLFEHGLAYEEEAPINWCPKDKTGLSNEEVVEGKCERCGTPVEKKLIKQWLLRITKYADRLLEDVQSLDWPQAIKEMQINWIGRKEGINIAYKVKDSDEEIVCFTTRPDTNFGASFVVIGPEHPMIQRITKKEYLDPVKRYINSTMNRSEEERIAQGRAKTGVFTGSVAINNLNGRELPIWVSDFVLGNVGTGMVVGVPGHDLRDFEFASEFKLPIIRVVVGKDGDRSEITKREQVQEEEGVMVNSDFLNGMDIHRATNLIRDYLEEKGWGKRAVSYHLRDWIFSRQRYWGEPIPIIHCEKCGLVPVPAKDLPLKLPEVKKYEPTGTGQSPLAAINEWVETSCPNCGGKAKRETNTMPNWAGSSWYYLRFADPKNDNVLIQKDIERYWLPVDWYVGGAEHAVLHLLYARFWHKFLYDLGAITTTEPFMKLRNVGLVLSYDGQKMSKSKGNVITPDEIVKEYGADTLRLYEGFMGPFDNTISWDPTSINGVYKFLNRVWELIRRPADQPERATEVEGFDSKGEVALNTLIIKVGSDIEDMKFNTAIASMMKFVNQIFNQSLTDDQKKRFLCLLAPFAPHISEELWEMLGNKQSIHLEKWPDSNEKYLRQETVNIAVQINGKVRDIVKITSDILNKENDILNLVLARPKIRKYLDGKLPKKIIYKPGKILSLVT